MMELLIPGRKIKRSMAVCSQCPKHRGSRRSKYSEGDKSCRLDDGYAYKGVYQLELSEKKYVRCDVDEKCPYKMEHIVMLGKRYRRSV